jgi:hypothetical protein
VAGGTEHEQHASTRSARDRAQRALGMAAIVDDDHRKGCVLASANYFAASIEQETARAIGFPLAGVSASSPFFRAKSTTR